MTEHPIVTKLLTQSSKKTLVRSLILALFVATSLVVFFAKVSKSVLLVCQVGVCEVGQVSHVGFEVGFGVVGFSIVVFGVVVFGAVGFVVGQVIQVSHMGFKVVFGVVGFGVVGFGVVLRVVVGLRVEGGLVGLVAVVSL